MKSENYLTLINLFYILFWYVHKTNLFSFWSILGPFHSIFGIAFFPLIQQPIKPFNIFRSDCIFGVNPKWTLTLCFLFIIFKPLINKFLKSILNKQTLKKK